MHCRKDICYFYRLMSNISLWMTPLQAKIILRLEKINKVPLRYNVGDVVYTGQINKSVWSWRDMGYYRRSTQYLSQFPKRLSSFFGTGKNINLTMLLAKALDLRHISCCPSNLFLCAGKNNLSNPATLPDMRLRRYNNMGKLSGHAKCICFCKTTNFFKTERPILS